MKNAFNPTSNSTILIHVTRALHTHLNRNWAIPVLLQLRSQLNSLAFGIFFKEQLDTFMDQLHFVQFESASRLATPTFTVGMKIFILEFQVPTIE